MRDSFHKLLYTVAELNGHNLYRRPHEESSWFTLDCIYCKKNLFADGYAGGEHLCADILITKPCGSSDYYDSKALYSMFIESGILNVTVNNSLISGQYP